MYTIRIFTDTTVDVISAPKFSYEHGSKGEIYLSVFPSVTSDKHDTYLIKSEKTNYTKFTVHNENREKMLEL